MKTDALEISDNMLAIPVIGSGSAINEAAVVAADERRTVEGVRDGWAESLTLKKSVCGVSYSRHVNSLPGGSG